RGRGVGFEADKLVAGKPHLAAARLQEPIKEIEQRCLAGTIRPYDTHDLAVTDLEAHVRDRPQTTERFRNPAHRQYRFARRRRRRRGRDNVRCKRRRLHRARCPSTLELVAHAPENAFRREQHHEDDGDAVYDTLNPRDYVAKVRLERPAQGGRDGGPDQRPPQDPEAAEQGIAQRLRRRKPPEPAVWCPPEQTHCVYPARRSRDRTAEHDRTHLPG